MCRTLTADYSCFLFGFPLAAREILMSFPAMRDLLSAFVSSLEQLIRSDCTEENVLLLSTTAAAATIKMNCALARCTETRNLMPETNRWQNVFIADDFGVKLLLDIDENDLKTGT